METLGKHLPLASQLADWQSFYRREFGIRIADVTLPTQKVGFERLVVIPPNFTLEEALTRCSKHYPVFRCWRDNSSADSIVLRNDSRPSAAYAMAIPDVSSIEPGMSRQTTIEWTEAGHAGMTLFEGVLFSLKHFTETGASIRMGSGVLCTGTRLHGGLVPYLCSHMVESPTGIAVCFQEPDLPISQKCFCEVHFTAPT
jgi:hypothetical protein